MELLIETDQFVIKYSPIWMFLLLFSGLLMFFISKLWRERLKRVHKHSFVPALFFTVSFIFLLGGINLFVYKIVLNKDKIILFNIKHFNQQIKWIEIHRVAYQSNQQIMIFMNELAEQKSPVQIDLAELDKSSMLKVRTLINLKLKQSKRKLSRQKINRTN